MAQPQDEPRHMRIVSRSYDDEPGALERVLVMLYERAERQLAAARQQVKPPDADSSRVSRRLRQ
jgi:hypothetical protein